MDTSAAGDVVPFAPRERPGIHGIGDDKATDAQVVLGNRVGDAVPLGLNRPPGVSQGLLD